MGIILREKNHREKMKGSWVTTGSLCRKVRMRFKNCSEAVVRSYARAFTEIERKITITRIFTCFGNYGRPDMAITRFMQTLLDDENREKKLTMFGDGDGQLERLLSRVRRVFGDRESAVEGKRVDVRNGQRFERRSGDFKTAREFGAKSRI